MIAVENLCAVKSACSTCFGSIPAYMVVITVNILQGLLVYRLLVILIYVLDTPGVLSSRFANDDSGSRLALTGTNYYEVYACMRSKNCEV
jgi:hypothetical protein